MLRNYIVKFLIILGLPKAFRFFYQSRKISIIYYHNIIPSCFEEHVKYIKRKYNVIDLSTLLETLTNKSAKIPKRALLITFDDGHIGNYKLLPIFKNYEIKPIIFLTSGIIGTPNPFWFNLPFSDKSEKDRLKLIPDKERREYINKNFSGELLPINPEALTKKMIEEMIPYVDFQSHTVDHPCLPNCSFDEAMNQLLESKSAIEKITGKPVISIAYPNGDFSDREMKLANDTGYIVGFASKFGFVNHRSNNYCLNRVSINDTCNYNEFILRATGVWSTIKKQKFM